MPDYLLDTGILVRHLRNMPGYPKLIDQLTDEADVFISAITRIEIIRGMRDREREATFLLLNSFETIFLTSEVADLAGNLIREGKGRGETIGEADAVIAASALHNNLALVTTNAKHFLMEELIVLQADEEGNLTSR